MRKEYIAPSAEVRMTATLLSRLPLLCNSVVLGNEGYETENEGDW